MLTLRSLDSLAGSCGYKIANMTITIFTFSHVVTTVTLCTMSQS